MKEIDPQLKTVVAERLESIRLKSNGVLTPDNVVKDAKNPSSPLHQLFPWDDKQAAHKYRLAVARRLIRSVHVEHHTETRTVEIPRYIRDQRQPAHTQGYTAVVEVKSSESIARESLLYEFKRAVAALERACDIADGLGLGAEVAALVKRMRVLQDRLAA